MTGLEKGRMGKEGRGGVREVTKENRRGEAEFRGAAEDLSLPLPLPLVCRHACGGGERAAVVSYGEAAPMCGSRGERPQRKRVQV